MQYFCPRFIGVMKFGQNVGKIHFLKAGGDMSNQKKDYSEFEETEYDKYRSIRSNKKNFQLNYFCNNVLFENKGRFTIDVDPFHEYYAMYDELVAYEKERAEREDRCPNNVSLFEDSVLGDNARRGVRLLRHAIVGRIVLPDS